jgi:hypothetical protein
MHRSLFCSDLPLDEMVVIQTRNAINADEEPFASCFFLLTFPILFSISISTQMLVQFVPLSSMASFSE